MASDGPWQPVGATYVSARKPEHPGRWLVLFSRYDAASGRFEFAKRVVENADLPTMSQAGHGEVLE